MTFPPGPLREAHHAPAPGNAPATAARAVARLAHTRAEPGDLRSMRSPLGTSARQKIFGRETVDSASGAASLILTERGRSVGSLGPGLTSDSADAVRAVLRDDLSAGPQVLWHLPVVPA